MADRHLATTYDVIIVGMGPAGAVAATALCRGGLTVLGFDKDAHPRYKVCGGGLSARIDRLLEPGFKSVVEQTVNGVQFVYRGQDPLLIESSQPIAYMVMRDRFDHYLVQQAIHAGAELRTGEGVVEITQNSDRVGVVTQEGRYHARMVIGADGANSLVARQLFPNRSLYRAPALESEVRLGNSRHYPSASTILVDVGAARQGYGWIFPRRMACLWGWESFVASRAVCVRLSIGLSAKRGGCPAGRCRGRSGIPSLPIQILKAGIVRALAPRSSVDERHWWVMPVTWSTRCSGKEFIMQFDRDSSLPVRYWGIVMIIADR